MFRKKFDPSPRGVPLDHLEYALSRTTLKISRQAESLIAEHERTATKLEVIPPAQDEVSEETLQAVVRVTTDLSEIFPSSLLTEELLMTLNHSASIRSDHHRERPMFYWLKTHRI